MNPNRVIILSIDRTVKPCGETQVQQGPPVAENLCRNVTEWWPRINAAKNEEIPSATRQKGAKSSSIRKKAGSNAYTSLLPGIPSASGGNEDCGIALSASLQFQELAKNSSEFRSTRKNHTSKNSLETFVFKNPSIGLVRGELSFDSPFSLGGAVFPTSVSHPVK